MNWLQQESLAQRLVKCKGNDADTTLAADARYILTSAA